MPTRPAYYGSFVAINTLFIGIISAFIFNNVYFVLLPATVALIISYSLINQEFNARAYIEKIAKFALFLSAAISVFITIAILFSILFEAIRFFNLVPIMDFLFGVHWSPQSESGFGIIPVLWGTILIMLVAMAVAVPIGLFSAIYMAEYASEKLRKIAKPALEILAGIPTVVYGYFAITTLAPFLQQMGGYIHLDIASESALVAGAVMGIMIVPFVSSLSDDIIHSVPQNLRDSSLALGATKSETITKVVLPAALPGIMGAVLLAVSRAIGETMIVVMAAGLSANLTINPLEPVTTATVQIVALLTGDQEFESAKTLAAFALGLVLFVSTLLLNVIALVIVKKYRNKYS